MSAPGSARTSKLDRAVWLLVAFAVFYFGGHLVAFGLRHDPAPVRDLSHADRVAVCVERGYTVAACEWAHDDK